MKVTNLDGLSACVCVCVYYKLLNLVVIDAAMPL